jgi:hypothetical protein
MNATEIFAHPQKTGKWNRRAICPRATRPVSTEKNVVATLYLYQLDSASP